MTMLGFFQNLGMTELLVILGIALLLFGRRLPEVGRSLGKGIVEFKKGLKGIEQDIEEQSSRPDAPKKQFPEQPLIHTDQRRVGVADAVEEPEHVEAQEPRKV